MRPAARVLVVEDQALVADLVVRVLQDAGYRTEHAATGEEGLARLARELFDVVVLDINLPGVSGMDVLEAGLSVQTSASFVMMTGFGSSAQAVEAMRLGAYTYLSKPVDPAELLLVIARALREAELRSEVARLRDGGGATSRIPGLVGRSPAIGRLAEMIERVAPTRSTVLIFGETGTGKEVVARAIHQLSDRARRAFMAVNCSALPETLLESELFGHVKGAFTGAAGTRKGIIEEAHGGTLFLDEIATITPAVQVKLLRVLQEKAIQRVGSSAAIPVDFRLVAAANVDLEREVQAGRFREDLFYRLSVFPLRVPALRERPEDIPLLAHHFRMRFARENGEEAPPFSAAALDRMSGYDWPGNVRELEHYVERALILHAGSAVLPFDPPARGEAAAPGAGMLARAAENQWTLERLEREYILSTLAGTGGHRGRAAELLGIDRRTLHRKLKEYALPGG